MNDRHVRVGFDEETLDLRLEQIIPVKPVMSSTRDSRKYKQIKSSIQEVGIIEPPVVTREKASSELYILLDGHLRIEVLKELGERVVSLEREYRLVEENYSTDVLNLTLAKGYLGKLLKNPKIVRYLEQNHEEILSQFQKIADMHSISEKIKA